MYFILALVIIPAIWVVCVGECPPAPWNTAGFTGQLRALYRSDLFFFRLIFGLSGLALLLLLIVF